MRPCIKHLPFSGTCVVRPSALSFAPQSYEYPQLFQKTLFTLPMLIDSEPTVGNTLGAIFIGTIVSAVLFGVTTLQTYIYWQRYPTDRVFFKCVVMSLWTLDGLVLAFDIHALYYYSVIHYGDYASVEHTIWSIKAHVLATSMLIPLVDSMYAYRIWKLYSGIKIVPILVTTAVSGGWAIGIVTSVKMFRVEGLVGHYSPPTIFADFSICLCVDLLVAATLCCHLYRARLDALSLSSTLEKLIYWTMGTGLLTSACAFLILITYALWSHNLIFLAIELPLAKLYVNSFLAMLNARQYLQQSVQKTPGFSIDKSTSRVTISPRNYFSSSIQIQPPAVSASYV